MLDRFPADTLRPGDVIATNDPWMGTGHLFDVNVMAPIFLRDRLIGYSMSITHLPDIGGRGFSVTGRTIYEEGLRLPVVRLVKEGEPNRELLELIRTNVRVPDHVVGDLNANITCNTVAGRLLLELMDEYGIDDLGPLAGQILALSERAMRENPARFPTAATSTTSTSRARRRRSASPARSPSRATAFTSTSRGPLSRHRLRHQRAPLLHAGVRRVRDQVPHHADDPEQRGLASSHHALAPEGCILNARPPYPTGGRHIVGHFVTPLVMGALAQAGVRDIPAGAGMQNLMNFQGRHRNGQDVSSIYFAAGGYGALEGLDGAACMPFPSNMTSTPVEVWEVLTGTLMEKKALLPDSGVPAATGAASAR